MTNGDIKKILEEHLKRLSKVGETGDEGIIVVSTAQMIALGKLLMDMNNDPGEYGTSHAEG